MKMLLLNLLFSWGLHHVGILLPIVSRWSLECSILVHSAYSVPSGWIFVIKFFQRLVKPDWTPPQFFVRGDTVWRGEWWAPSLFLSSLPSVGTVWWFVFKINLFGFRIAMETPMDVSRKGFPERLIEKEDLPWYRQHHCSILDSIKWK